MANRTLRCEDRTIRPGARPDASLGGRLPAGLCGRASPGGAADGRYPWAAGRWMSWRAQTSTIVSAWRAAIASTAARAPARVVTVGTA